jgi:hypothetical protein
MFAGLARAIAELDVPPTLECLEEVLSFRDRLDAKISTALRQFEEDEGWCEDRSLSRMSRPSAFCCTQATNGK